MKYEEAIKADLKAGELAYKRAFKKTLKWFQSNAIKAATKELGVRRSALKGRWFANVSENSLWVGLNPLPVHRYGKPRQNKRGVKSGGQQYDGAFVMNEKLVMIRTSKARLPIEVVTKEISDDVKTAIHRVRPLAIARFRELYKQELNYARKHEKR